MINILEDSQYCASNMHSIFNEHVIYSITNTQGIITNVSEAFCKETGYEKKDVIGKTHSFLKAPDFPESTYEDLWDTITKDEVWKGQINNLRRNGESYWTKSIIQPLYNTKHKKMGYLAIRQNITKEKTCEQLSNVDELTGAFNRRKFNLELNKYLLDYYRYSDNFSLIMIDIDHFKNFNDNHGHLIGDEVLKRVCYVMQKNIRQGDFFARWGGEEFVLLLNRIDKSLAEKSCQSLLNIVRKDLPIFLRENFQIKVKLTCSMGITSPIHSDSGDSLLARVDTALYNAKHNGRNRVEIL